MGLVNKPPTEFVLSSKSLMQLSLCSETHALGDPISSTIPFDVAEICHQQDGLFVS